MSTKGQSVVLLVSDEYPPYTAWGGVSYHSANLAKLLNEAGHRVEILAESDTDEEFIHLDDRGNLVHRLRGEQSSVFKFFKRIAPRLAGKLAFRDLLLAARVAERAYELATMWGRDFAWIESTSWRAPTLFLHLIPSLNERLIVRNVTPMAEVMKQNRTVTSSWASRAGLWQEILQQSLLKSRFYSNQEYRSYFEKLVPRLKSLQRKQEDRVFLLPFDFTRVNPREVAKPKGKRSRARGRYRIVMVGRIEARKGFDVVCSALAGLTEEQRARLEIVAIGRDTATGPLGSYRALLEERFPGIADACITYLGQVSDEELRKQLDKADCGLVASTSESFGFNLVELLAADLPVLTSDVGAASEFERRGIQYLGKYQDAAELSLMLSDLPTRLAAHARKKPNNRARLEAIYRSNDEEYLAYTRKLLREVVPLHAPQARPEPPLRSASVVICSYARFDELTLSLPSAVREVQRAIAAGIPCDLTIVYQNEGLPERIHRWRPDWGPKQDLRFVFSSPPSLTKARNVGIRSTSGDLILFIDDDVVLDPGFVIEHFKAAEANPGAIGVAGRIRSQARDNRKTHHRAIGQIRSTGFVLTNFDSVNDTSILVPQTPMGVNMSYKRRAMKALFGPAWFDEGLSGSSFREESTLAVEIFRRGRYFVYAPDASLYHFESIEGGCSNRGERTLKQQVAHAALDYLFLNRLYLRNPAARITGPLIAAARDIKNTQGLRHRLRKVGVDLVGFVLARRTHARAPVPRLAPADAAEPGTGNGEAVG